jgi:hypothetical protein
MSTTLAAFPTPRLQPSALLRFALRLDGAVSLLAGLATLAGAGLVAGLLGLPGTATLALGAFMASYGAVLLWLGGQSSLSAGLVGFLSYGNGAWAVLSVLATLVGWLGVGLTGQVVMIGQAVLVGIFAVLQGLGGRQSRSAQ